MASNCTSDNYNINIDSRSFIHGFGINDSDYKTKMSLGSGLGSWQCPYYKAWVQMITRAYSEKSIENRPTYENVTVCQQWKSFMTFRKWMETQEWQGRILDKDISQDGQEKMIYSPDTCFFVSMELNSLFKKPVRKNEWGLGVERMPSLKFRARIKHNGKYHRSKPFKRQEDAQNAYSRARAKIVQGFLPTGNIKLDLILHEKIKQYNKGIE